MSRSSLIALILGAALAAWLIATNDVAAVVAVVVGAGWGVLWVLPLHAAQTLASAWAWRALIPEPAPPLRSLFALRWVREAVNALLPVAQVGGDVARARLLARQGVKAADAAASCAVDLSVEMTSQIVFSLAGLVALLGASGRPAALGSILLALAFATLVAGSFMASQRFGLFKLLEPWLARRAARKTSRGGQGGLGDLTGLNDAVVRHYRDPRALALSGAGHLLSWALGAVETYAAMRALHLQTDARSALVVESLGQAIRGLGFLVPGALGVQEGGYILICGLVGVGAQGALALSLVRRMRELVLGGPGLELWRRLERRPPSGPPTERAGASGRAAGGSSASGAQAPPPGG